MDQHAVAGFTRFTPGADGAHDPGRVLARA
jgi:hypothetical protein